MCKPVYTLQGWYKNAETFNLIGFLRALKKPVHLDKIWEKWQQAADKAAFAIELKELIKPEISYYDDNYLGLNYGSPNTRNLLLLLNLATLLNKPGEKTRFSFSNFHRFNWDIEHISPQNPKSIEVFLADVDADSLPDELKDWNQADDKKRHELIDKYTTSTPNVLQNLTLLTAHDNRGIGNKHFFEKREVLKRYLKEGSFIPHCSINVFVKFYTVNPVNLNYWDLDKDGQGYLKYIEDTIEKFFKPETRNDQLQ